jgi:hypothetical protein
MNIGEILIWEATNGLLLIPVLIALVILTRWIGRRPLFTDRDWSEGESSLASPLAQVRGALVRGGAHRLC